MLRPSLCRQVQGRDTIVGRHRRQLGSFGHQEIHDRGTAEPDGFVQGSGAQAVPCPQRRRRCLVRSTGGGAHPGQEAGRHAPAPGLRRAVQRRVEALVARGDERGSALADERGELGVAAAGDKVQRGVPVARHAEEASRSRARRRHCAR